MSKPEVLVIGPYPAWDMEDLESRYVIHKLWEAEDRDAFLAGHAGGIRAIATRGELGASADLMKRLPKLEIVSCYGVGTDAIDLRFARENGIRVTNTPDVLTEDVADLGMALMLAAARQLPAGDAYVRGGQWTKGNMHLTTRVCGKRVGVVGMGRIGAAFARRAAAFDCTISYFARAPKPDLPYTFVGDLVALARQSDFLVVTLAGGEGTRGIVSAEVIEALGPDGIFVNISRGTTVDEAALLDALEQGRIRGAGLDVFLNEPAIDPRFASLKNAVLQPHHGSGTVETRQAMGKLVRDNLAAHFSGVPLLTPVA
ncbi:2-hydroxyacid dehydrogenase [Pararhizobium polonicum]|uniref:2-hydroxyacid dehydrogenase n=1 Tax=Pararhizobium polonicum TaxID=1612624 RepID=A0A1C7P0Y7_9HYPH|nr:2-hydroxyacid dehydrogenase [Pararhizobium polonicum]OBZ94963.1 2-hydroxyacid dehydrogenase [Pararhizobium polonicum]